MIHCRDDRFGVNNVATTAASVSTYAALTAFGKLDLVLSVGTAGGFSQRGACIGDVFLSTKCVFHARRIPEISKTEKQNLNCMALEEYGFGNFRSPNLIGLAHAANLKLGVVSTSDSLDCSDNDMALMMSEGATVKEMEAAAVAWVCYHAGVPFVAIKSITDIVDQHHIENDHNKLESTSTRDMFEDNFQHAVTTLKDRIRTVLNLLDNAKLSTFKQITSMR
jgi:nucleoside phosphorylase